MSLFLNTNFITLLQMVLFVALAGTRRATLPIVVCMLSIFLGVRLYNAPEVEPAPITLQPPQPFPVNNALNASHVAMHWGVHGPETFAVGPDGWIYTGTADGRIVKFQSAHMQPVEVVRTGKLLRECGSYAAEPECGRPLGMQFNSAGKLIVCDGYYGLLEVDVQVGRIEVLATEAEGRHFVFLNSLVTDAPDGNYYITESSGRHTRRDVSLEVMEAQPTGRLLKFDPRTRTMTVLLRDQPFPNGLTLSHDKTELLMCLWSKMQVVAYSLKDAQVRVVADNLPGPPDNITPRPNGQSYWVALSFYRNPEFSLYDMTAAMPRVRWLMLKLFGPRWFVSILAARDGMIVEMDGSGRLLSSLMDRTGTIFYLSEAFEHEGHLYLGSFINPFLGKVPVSQVVQH